MEAAESRGGEVEDLSNDHRDGEERIEAREVQGALKEVNVATLRELIDAHLRKTNVYAEIRQFISEFTKLEPGGHDVFDTLKERKIIDQVIQSLQTQKSLTLRPDGKEAEANATTYETVKKAMVPGEQYLLVKVLGGRHFGNPSEGGKQSNFVLRAHFGSQRFESKPVVCTEEPRFDCSFLVRLSNQFVLSSEARTFDRQITGLRRLLRQGNDENNGAGYRGNSSKVDLDSSMRQMLHLVLLRCDADEQEGPFELVASHMMEWRRILSNTGGATVVVELTGLGPASKIRVPIGALDIRLDLVPSIRIGDTKSSPLLGKQEVDSVLKKESAHFAQANRRFYQYARLWWQEYIEMNPLFRNRLVKIFAENEWGEHSPSCTFVWPMRAGRVLDTPRHAARFVSLIPYVREEAVGGGRVEVWHTAHSFLSKAQGDCEDHAILLCSLLLGFGLRAYLCVGTVQDRKDAAERDHVWVATLSGKKGQNCTFWESLTGQKVENPHKELKPAGRDIEESRRGPQVYKRIGCMFNHEQFFANKQLDDRVSKCSFDLDDDMRWKSMDERLVGSLKRYSPPPLLKPSICEATLAEEIERSLRSAIEQERSEQLSLSTQWDDNLSYYLTPALSAYEMERCTGILFGNEEFQESIKRHIPTSHSFKGYPTMFSHRNPDRIFHALRQSSVASDILATRADHTHFALRVRVFAYPENICAVWVMLAVRGRFS